MDKYLVEFKGLRTYFSTGYGEVKAVDNVSFKIKEGETVCIVGESGSGKSVTAMSLMRLIATPPGKIVAGEILFKGRDVLKLSEKEMRGIRGREMSMIFQEPMTSLNPVIKVGNQIIEAIILHKNVSKSQARSEAIDTLKLIGIARSEEIMKSYPHELSGGMRQRIMIAMAMCCRPKLLIADEPTTALDVTIQAQILDLMRDVKKDLNTSILMITHDLGVVAEMADYVVVMYGGKVIEEGTAMEIFKNPLHPYTKGLLASKPVLNAESDRLYSIPGQVPEIINMKENCYFNPRCEHCMDICINKEPKLIKINDNHKVACWLYPEAKNPDKGL